MPRFASRWMRFALLLVPIALAAAGCGKPTLAHSQEIVVPAQPLSGRTTFSDEFDGESGTAPDMTRWSYDLGSSGWPSNESQFYTSDRKNLALDGFGHLAIVADQTGDRSHACWNGPCEYSSGRLSTYRKFTQRYGIFEARIKMPPGSGMLPAFWLVGDNIHDVGWPACGEIDVMEFPGKERSAIYGSIHGPGYSRGAKYLLPEARSFSDDFHVFTLYWTPGSLVYAVDGLQYKRITPADTAGSAWVFDRPFFIVVNLAVGGKWAGNPDRGDVFPQRMLVDYVRAYSWDPDKMITK